MAVPLSDTGVPRGGSSGSRVARAADDAGDLDSEVIHTPANPATAGLERAIFDKHGMVLDHRAVIEHRNTMKMSACKYLPVPADTRREGGKSVSYNDLYVI